MQSRATSTSLMPPCRRSRRDAPVPLTVDQGKALITEFCATYPVAYQIQYKVRETQEELYGQEFSKETVGKIFGGFRPGRGQADFATANFRDADEFKDTIRHEVLGHFGINTF